VARRACESRATPAQAAASGALALASPPGPLGLRACLKWPTLRGRSRRLPAFGRHHSLSGARPPGRTRDASGRGAREGAGSASVSERPATGPRRRGSAAERGQAGQAARPARRASGVVVAREGKSSGVAVLAFGRRPFPAIGVRAGSAPPRRDARQFPWPRTSDELPSVSHGEAV
jgi:hypothetical protein